MEKKVNKKNVKPITNIKVIYNNVHKIHNKIEKTEHVWLDLIHLFRKKTSVVCLLS